MIYVLILILFFKCTHTYICIYIYIHSPVGSSKVFLNLLEYLDDTLIGWSTCFHVCILFPSTNMLHCTRGPTDSSSGGKLCSDDHHRCGLEALPGLPTRGFRWASWAVLNQPSTNMCLNILIHVRIITSIAHPWFLWHLGAICIFVSPLQWQWIPWRAEILIARWHWDGAKHPGPACGPSGAKQPARGATGSWAWTNLEWLYAHTSKM